MWKMELSVVSSLRRSLWDENQFESRVNLFYELVDVLSLHWNKLSLQPKLV